MSELLEKCTLAKDAGYKMVSVSTVTKDNALEAIANALVERADEIIAANNIDIENAKKNGTRQAMIDRLTLTKERIDGIAEGVRQVKALAKSTVSFFFPGNTARTNDNRRSGK